MEIIAETAARIAGMNIKTRDVFPTWGHSGPRSFELMVALMLIGTAECFRHVDRIQARFVRPLPELSFVHAHAAAFVTACWALAIITVALVAFTPAYRRICLMGRGAAMLCASAVSGFVAFAFSNEFDWSFAAISYGFIALRTAAVGIVHLRRMHGAELGA